jgi:hypothetical protein
VPMVLTEDQLGLGPAEGDEGDAAEVQDGVGAGFLPGADDGVEVAHIHRMAGDLAAGGAGDVAADTSWPACRRAATACRPTNPLQPVTRTFIISTEFRSQNSES